MSICLRELIIWCERKMNARKIPLGKIFVVISIIASCIQILSYFNVHQNDLFDNRVSPSYIVNNNFEYSDKIFKNTYINLLGNNLTGFLDEFENNCSRDYPDLSLERLRCLVLTGQLFSGMSMYRDAYRCFSKAKGVDSRIADPYFSIGNIYYDLSLIDLLRKHNFDYDNDTLKFTLYPDDHTKELFKLAEEAYSDGDKLKTLEEIDPALLSMGNITFVLTDWPLISHRRKQIKEVFSGSRSISAAYSELIFLPLRAKYIYKSNDTFIRDMDLFQKNASLKLKHANMIADGLQKQLADISFHKGNALVAEGNYNEALQRYDDAIYSDPYHFAAWTNKGNVLYAQGKYDEALQAYNKATDIDPNSDIAWLNKGSVFAALGKNNEALQTYGRCISINPKCAKAWYGKGLVLQMLGRTKEADAAFAKAKELELSKENDFDPY